MGVWNHIRNFLSLLVRVFFKPPRDPESGPVTSSEANQAIELPPLIEPILTVEKEDPGTEAAKDESVIIVQDEPEPAPPVQPILVPVQSFPVIDNSPALPDGKPAREPEQVESTLDAPSITVQPAAENEAASADTEEKRTRKPRQKQIPTAESSNKEPSELNDSTQGEGKKRKTTVSKIELGATRKTRKVHPVEKAGPSDEVDKSGELETDATQARDASQRVLAPTVVFNLGAESHVSIVIPEQQIGSGTGSPDPALYEITLDGEHFTKQLSIRKEAGVSIVEEVTFVTSKPIGRFEIWYPSVVGGKQFVYNHKHRGVYIFTAVGADRGKLLFNIETLPKRPVWLLAGRAFKVLSEIEVSDERNPWPKHSCSIVDLSTKEFLVLLNETTGEVLKIPCVPTFEIHSNSRIIDDVGMASPIFTESPITISAPHTNESGWRVWIQRAGLSQPISDSYWDGSSGLELDGLFGGSIPPGEYQIDIMDERPGSESVAMFLRFLPHLEIEWQHSLMIPQGGHVDAPVRVRSLGAEVYELEANASVEPLLMGEWSSLEVPGDKDSVRFAIVTPSARRVPISVRLPRLRWQVTKSMDHEVLNDLPVTLTHDQLDPGVPLYLIIETKDRRNDYRMTAKLVGSQVSQEATLDNRRSKHILSLGQFYDTVRSLKSQACLKVSITFRDSGDFAGSVEPVLFAPRPVSPVAVRQARPASLESISPPRLCFALRQIRDSFPLEGRKVKRLRKMHHRHRHVGTKNRVPERVSLRTEFVLNSLAFLKYLFEKHEGSFSLRGCEKWKQRIASAETRYGEEFAQYYLRWSQMDD